MVQHPLFDGENGLKPREPRMLPNWAIAILLVIGLLAIFWTFILD